MEYPIIDTLTNAYIRNGWTGLVLTYGKNLFNGGSINGVSWAYDTVNEELGQFINNLEDGIYTISYDCTIVEVYDRFTSETARANTGRIVLVGNDQAQNTGIEITRQQALNGYSNRYYVTFNKMGNFLHIYFYGLGRNAATEGAPNGALGVANITNIQIEKGTQATPYEPYVPPTTDIFSRTRLPIIRHYPYALIDALQRASTGTQTADDTEVLRHYLTPLGIGGI